ncbi:hypothetical protein, conserved [Leishmania tarentolae]|uniref:Uncharacterized protein n=1 Tax=Leishmania tarentolae TaxID=5689 RepID=A0A640KNQ7_LEITA|nr:hypothetical protein, conserved [Leishmania tarentolae]
MHLFSSLKQKKKDAASSPKMTGALPGPKNSQQSAFSGDKRASAGERLSQLPPPSPQSLSTNSRSNVDTVSSGSLPKQPPRQPSVHEKASELAMPRLQRASGALHGTPNLRASGSTESFVHDATTGLAARKSSAAESPASKSASRNSTPATVEMNLTSPTQQSPVARLSACDVCTVRRLSVHLMSPLPPNSGENIPKGLPERTDVLSPSSMTGISALPRQQPALSKLCPVASAGSPLTPQPPPPRSAPSPVFTAMESVNRPDSALRVLKRPKNSSEPGSNVSGESFSSETSKNVKKDTMAVSANANTDAGVGKSSNSAPGATLNSLSKEHPMHSKCTAANARDTRCEPVVGLVDGVDGSQRNSKSNVSVSAHIVPTPPPVNVGKVSSFYGTASTLQKSTRRTNSMYSSHSAQSSIDDASSLENPPSVRRSQCTSIRLSAPRISTKAANNCSLSLDDVPRPLTRHASTLSTEQQEALRRTASFLSRAHTPPPSNLRELVQVRKGRRVLQVRCNSPDVCSGSPGVHSTNEQSLSISATAVIRESTPSGDGDGKSPARSSTRTIRQASSLPGHEKKQGVSGQPSKDMLETDSASVSPNGPSDATSHSSFFNGRSAAKGKVNDARFPPEPGALSDTPGKNSCEAIKLPTQAPCISSPSPLRRDQTPEPRLATVSPPPLSRSPDPVDKSAAVSHSVGKKPSSSMSLLLDETAEFDFYGSCVLSTVQFNTEPQQRITPTPAPDDERASAPSVDEVVHGHPRPFQQAQEPRKPKTSHSGSATSAVKVKKQNDVSISVSESVPLGVSDFPGEASGTTATKSANSRKDERVTSTATTNQSKLSVNHVVTAQSSASRQRLVNVCIEDDEDGFYQVSSTKPTLNIASVKSQGTSHGNSSLVSVRPRGNGRHFPTAMPSTPNSSQSLRETPPVLDAAKLAAIAAPLRAQVSLSSNDDSDDDENEEEYDNLLEGFRPAGFDARRGSRTRSSIVFFLGNEDSLSSMDIVVRAANTVQGSGAIPSSLTDTKLLLQKQKQQSEYSASKLSTTVKAGGGGARPHVTFDPYIAESVHPPTQSTPSVLNLSIFDAQTNQSPSSPCRLDQYGFAMEASLSSLQLTENVQESGTVLNRNSVASVQSKPPAPVSIFLGTTPRFAPDTSKMHRPLANTFGYTNAQRRARAAAIAAGASAEEWARAAGIHEEDMDSDDSVYGEVYTDENGDQWYWEEVEDGESEEEEEEEEEDEESVSDSASALDKRCAGTCHSPAPISSVSAATANAKR